MARRKFTLDDKIKIIEELNNGFTHAQICKKYELSSSTLSTFKRQLDIINATEPKDYQPSVHVCCFKYQDQLFIQRKK